MADYRTKVKGSSRIGDNQDGHSESCNRLRPTTRKLVETTTPPEACRLFLRASNLREGSDKQYFGFPLFLLINASAGQCQ